MKKVYKRSTAVIGAIAVGVCCCAGLYGLTPFGTPMFCALTQYVFFAVLAPVYIACTYLFTFEVWRLYLAGAVVFIMGLDYFLGLKLPEYAREPVRITLSLVAIAAYSILLGVFSSIMSGALTFVSGALFYCFSRAAAGAVDRITFRPSGAERAAICVCLAAFGLAFGAAEAGDIRIGVAFAFLLSVSGTLVGSGTALSCAIAVGAGLGIKYGAPLALAFVVGTAGATAFRALARPVYAMIGVGCFVAAEIVLGVPPGNVGWDAVMAAVGVLPIAALPPKAARAISAYFDYDGSARLAVRHYINRTRADAGNRMLCLSSVFDETARLINGFREPPPDYAAIGESLSSGVCPYCPNSAVCEKAEREEAFISVARTAYAGRHVITELPPFFAERCIRTADVIGASAELAERAREREVRADSDRTAKATVTDRLTAVKDVLRELGNAQALPVGFDGRAEKRVESEIRQSGTECAEAFVTEAGVTAIVRTATAKKEALSRAVSVALGKRYELRALDSTQAAGWSVAVFSKKAEFEAVYARAGISKSEVSGDSYAFKRIDDRFLVALADGMGTGEGAGCGSGSAVELVECFYRAGFDSRSALAGVNRFLKLPGSEDFSAADVAVCDLSTGTLDMIKLGSPACYIKTADTVLKIEGSSLPIGVLDELRPYVAVKKLYPGQMLILVTDGVSDCFEGDELPAYINGLAAVNPEKVASDILRRALDISGGPRDDMTVIAFRLIRAPARKRY